MSFLNGARKFQPESGNKLHAREYADAVADALQRSFGAGAHAVKIVANRFSVSLRTARNWLEGKNGPTGAELIWMMRLNDDVCRTVLEIAERSEHMPTLTAQQRQAVVAMLEILNEASGEAANS